MNATVVAAVAVDRVVAVAAEQRLGARAAGDRVVAVAPVDGVLDRGRGEPRGSHGVVAADRIDPQQVVRGLGAR